MKLIILNGPSGVGKSTIAKRLHEEIPSSVLVDVDELRRTIPNYREQRKESSSLSYELAAGIIVSAFKSGQDVIVDKTISQGGVLDTFVEIAKKYGAEIYEFILFADKATIQKRADDRGYRPGSLLTREKVGELWEKIRVLQEERSSAVVVDTTHLDLEETFDRVSEIVRD